MNGDFQIRVIPARPSVKPAAVDWADPPQVLTPFGITAKFVVDEIGEIVPAAWKLSGPTSPIARAA